MNLRSSFSRVTAGLLATLGLTLIGPAHAGPTPHMMTGSWTGFFQGVGNPDFRGPASLEVSSQDNRRFTGIFTTGDMTCMLDGTISASMMMSASGDCGFMSHLVLQGRVSELDAAGGINPCTLDGRWSLNAPTGAVTGNLGLLHLQGGPVELASGHWEGRAVAPDSPDQPAMADFRAIPPDGGDRTMKQGVGTVMVGEAAFDIAYDIAVRAESDTHGFALVGGGESGILFVMGTFQPPDVGDRTAMIRARHVLELPSGDTLEGNVALHMTPPDSPD